jgi:isopentenyl diphosphate isomerase/L-lactate dehydrogenase-like FMN-dependent dehydrogenase
MDRASWGLSAFGQEGVEAALDILTRELTVAMRHARTQRLPGLA